MLDTALLEKMDKRIKKEVKAIKNIRVPKGSNLIFENGCLVDTVKSVEMVAPEYLENRPNWCKYATEILIFLSGDYSTKMVKVSGEDLVTGKVKIIKDRKYKTIQIARYSY